MACESLGTPCRICENVNNFNKIREIIQNACYFLFSTVLSKIFYIKCLHIVHKTKKKEVCEPLVLNTVCGNLEDL